MFSLHVLFVCNEYPPAPHGGIGAFVQTLAEALVERGHSASVIGRYGDGSLPSQIVQNGVMVHRLLMNKLRKVGPVWDRIMLYKAIEALIREQGVSVVEYPDFQSDLILRHRIPTVLRLHGSMSYYASFNKMAQSRFIHWVEQRAFRVADCVVGVSRFVLERTQTIFGHSPQHSRAIHNFVDTRLFQTPASDEDEPLILFYGSLIPRKGVLQLARAANQFLRRLSDAVLCFVGRDSLVNGQSCREMIVRELEPDLRARVVFSEAVPHLDLIRVIRRARVCVFPSYMEALPLAPLEAAAAGKAVVVSNLGPLPEMFEHGAHALLVDPDDVKRLSASIVQLFNGRALRDRLGRAARARVVERFSLERGLSANLDFYAEMVNKAGTQAAKVFVER